MYLKTYNEVVSVSVAFMHDYGIDNVDDNMPLFACQCESKICQDLGW